MIEKKKKCLGLRRLIERIALIIAGLMILTLLWPELIIGYQTWKALRCIRSAEDVERR
jgi:hypothetical protein